ncbi:MAG TPA: efflux transporter outer membrane subunit [Chlamydiales bacterium]|nr:efflux transporter outer membrane subunit [Chlamydiales bacterium]
MWLFVGLILLLHGCVPHPCHELATREESCGCDSLVEEARAQGFEMGDWPDAEWWNGFDDPVLTGLIEEGLKLNPTLKRAEENLKAASEVAKQKRAKLFPEVYFTGDSNWQHLSPSGFFREYAPTIPAVVNDLHLGFSFSYEFDFWGKNRMLFQSAMGIAAAAVAEKLQAELILTTSIAYTYEELQLLLRKRVLLTQIEANREAIEMIRLKRQQHALDGSIIQLQAKNNQLDASAPLLEIDDQIEVHFHKLKALTALGQDAILEIPYRAYNPLQVSIPECLSLDLIARRPDLIAQKWRVEAAAKQIGAAKTDFYPNVNITGLIGLESVFFSQLLKAKSYSANADPAFHLPIFTAGRIKAQLMEKVADFNQAVYDFNELILRAAQEIADTLSDMTRLQAEIELRQGSLEVVQKQEELTAKRFANALDDRIALLDSQNNVLEMEITLVELEYGKLLTSIQLIRAFGGGYHDCE